ncbi:hypothetical protein [Streptomyces sp. NPDC057052]|uniref:hypothetical protein n=1 Tax=Streptomyces sp. NPDC057052 TaxID=3346010 RepID=UPI00363A6726
MTTLPKTWFNNIIVGVVALLPALMAAGAVIAWALGRPLPDPVGQELNAAVQRHSPHRDATDGPE